jgi:hypothetical protein
MSVVTVRDGDIIELKPTEKKVVQFDYDEDNLAAGVTITNVFTIVVIKQNGATALTKDNPSMLAGNRKAQVRLDGTTATLGDLYELSSVATTDESPVQIKDKRIQVLIQ